MVVHILGTLYIPESPYFLIREEKIVDAEEALAKLRDPDHDWKSELVEIKVSSVKRVLYFVLLTLLETRRYLWSFLGEHKKQTIAEVLGLAIGFRLSSLG